MPGVWLGLDLLNQIPPCGRRMRHTHSVIRVEPSWGRYTSEWRHEHDAHGFSQFTGVGPQEGEKKPQDNPLSPRQSARGLAVVRKSPEPNPP